MCVLYNPCQSSQTCVYYIAIPLGTYEKARSINTGNLKCVTETYVYGEPRPLTLSLCLIFDLNPGLLLHMKKFAHIC